MRLQRARRAQGSAAPSGAAVAALWWARRQDRPAAPLVALAAFLAAVGLHGAWDGLDAPLASVVIATTSAALLLSWLVVARREAHEPLVAVAGLLDEVGRGSTPSSSGAVAPRGSNLRAEPSP